MPLKSLPVEEPSLNLTPMVDIVFLLIIFFMVGTQFSEMERSVEIQLPTVAEVTPLTNLPDAKIVEIREDGRFSYEQQDVTLSQLEQHLIAARENYSAQGVILRGDQRCSYQQIMNVIAVCKRAEIASISLANRPIVE
jgi:biopolymer transport protein ExbD